MFNFKPQFILDGSQFDHLFKDGSVFTIGNLAARALHVPGHAAADVAYHIGDAVFVGDTMFMPDVGTARCDFPGGNAHVLYRSIRSVLALPPLPASSSATTTRRKDAGRNGKRRLPSSARRISTSGKR